MFTDDPQPCPARFKFPCARLLKKPSTGITLSTNTYLLYPLTVTKITIYFFVTPVVVEYPALTVLGTDDVRFNAVAEDNGKEYTTRESFCLGL